MVPSSVSLATPVNVTMPTGRAALLVGAVMVRVGGVFPALVTLIPTDLYPTLPSESVTRAVMTCVPFVSVDVNVAPIPIWPWIELLQTSPAVSVPSSMSVAVPVNVMTLVEV